MLRGFFVYYAPFIVIIASIAAAFWLALKDEIFNNEND
ncbi:cytochrome bd oxidase small subunit CydS [Bacillus timonensis]